MVVGAIVVVVAIAVAVVKPWDAGSGSASLPSPFGSIASAAIAPTPAPLDPSDPVDAAAVLAALQPHDMWGMQVVGWETGTSPEPTLVEHWLKVVPTPDGGVSPLDVTSDPPIVALGITSPSEVTPLDVRAWVRGTDRRWHALEIGSFDSDRPDAALLLPPPTVDGATLPAWPPGTYRFDLLMGQTIYRLDVTIDPDLPSAEVPVSHWATTTGDGSMAWLDDIAAGPFAVSNGFVMRLASRGGPALRDPEAWLGLDGFVASAWLPSVTGLGVVLPSGSRDASAGIRRIAPEPGGPGVAMARVEVDAGTSETGVPFVVFHTTAGERLDPGVYAIDVSWNEVSGSRSLTWHIDLRPGPAARSSTLLDAARTYGAEAGVDGIVLRGAGRGETGARPAPVRTFAMAPEIGCGDDPTDETPAVIGLGHPADIHPRSITATLRVPGDRETDVPLRIAPVVIPGLTLIAPARDVAFAPGTYTFTTTALGTTRAFTLCLGSPSGG